MLDNSPIFLVGFMGSGKTTVGRELAHHLGYDFIDLDELISAQIGKSIPEIFSEFGEVEFRRLESAAILSCSDLVRSVIALGGGTYVDEDNRRMIRAIGKTVWLDCPLETCLDRIAGDESRPLLGDVEQMRELLAKRRESYAKADYVIGSGEQTPEDLVQMIVRLLQQ